MQARSFEFGLEFIQLRFIFWLLRLFIYTWKNSKKMNWRQYWERWLLKRPNKWTVASLGSAHFKVFCLPHLLLHGIKAGRWLLLSQYLDSSYRCWFWLVWWRQPLRLSAFENVGWKINHPITKNPIFLVSTPTAPELRFIRHQRTFCHWHSWLLGYVSYLSSHTVKTRLAVQNHFSLFHRVKTALRAISDLRRADNFLARALPPFKPPSLPRATAAGFFCWFNFLRDRLGMSHDCYFWKMMKVISIRRLNVSLNRLLIKS